MSLRAPNPGNRAVLAAIATVAATYAYFLLFAQFGFLRALQLAVGGEQEVIKHVLAIMGVAGIAGSLLATRLFKMGRESGALTAGFMACAVAALAVGAGVPGKYFSPMAALIGFGTGLVTVTLAGLLRASTGGDRLGLAIGFGTGAAYAFCNLPMVFNAAPIIQARIAFAIAMLGGLAALQMKPQPGNGDVVHFDYSPGGIALWVLVFFSLVSLDSGAFYVIQHNSELKGPTWTGAWRLEIIAVIHFFAGVIAGLACDRRWTGRTVALAAVLLVTGCVCINFVPRWADRGTLLYAAAVSMYSVALVYYSSRSARPMVAATVYAIAGWVGSAVGIGAIENLPLLPAWFIGAAGIVLAAVLGLRWFFVRKNLRQGALVTGLLVSLGSLAGPSSKADELSLVDRGRAVFISEGCVHCHSQYVRPESLDVTRWGPVATVAMALRKSPPLLGNRRQGPDLQNVGNRRTAEWNRLHLISPQSVVPGSRMPSYAYLFRSGAGEGTALLAYLDSLGGDTLMDRVTANQHWRPAEEAVIFTPAQQHELFTQWCAACHGLAARGDGPVAASLAIKPRDLVEGVRERTAAGADLQRERFELGRLIKFGILGTTMAGHEYLSDDAVLSLAAYVQTVRTKK